MSGVFRVLKEKRVYFFKIKKLKISTFSRSHLVTSLQGSSHDLHLANALKAVINSPIRHLD